MKFKDFKDIQDFKNFQESKNNNLEDDLFGVVFIVLSFILIYIAILMFIWYS